MDYVEVTSVSILIGFVLLWAKISKLDLGLRTPSFKGAWPWIMLFIGWRAIELVVVTVQQYEVDPQHVEQQEQISLLADIVKSAVLAPIFEELLFRGAMFSALLRRWGIWAAVAVPSFLWAFIHIRYDIWIVAWLAGFGIILAVIRWKSGSLYLPLTLHAAHNLALIPHDHGLLTSIA